ncbi:MAG: hypothetical protein HC899_27520 [Leptolyngbyaceae cyanobacterium SM1_4_3]|nr:hypothetical protein [Leptolyngbyaceae cyanobacterium SM1_4_3]
MSLHQHHEEELKKDLELLKEYEEERRLARDPQERRRYQKKIQDYNNKSPRGKLKSNH